MFALAGAAGVSAPALAQDPPAAAAEGQGAAPSGEAEGYTAPTAFSGSSNEDMKYRNLWMAYAAIWLLVFAFIWRTWSKQQGTARELDDLRKRINAIEESEGGA